ncbi:LysE/ArgO family amino acid transporter [Nocardioides sp. TRM66260-LWL]|uniref:LysE/ArgO family amino acid transporter n=1 Tax=Nocardioides sp. TRM66260-LWL TaxID=2874478 RepID=UPI001CC39851|nr:LysE/ArgO family amino acid transporter [Nocardioides sp. TRM66260-LWL]MBZ5734470.1 LysE/ArgO family amino acid transporter [Nocardioides sp. TRM66260-LWL]
MPTVLATVLAGLLTGGSLIVAIGAQNAYVLRQGVLRQHVGAVVAVCLLSDAVLIVAGVAGIGAIVSRAGWLIDVVTWLGVAFLLWYAASSLRRALRPEALEAAQAGEGTARSVVGRAMALTWLNPHVYLDTVLLLGSIAASHRGDATPGLPGQAWFAVGAVLASALWFTGLGYGARLLGPVLARPRSWQVLEVLIAVTMVGIAARLALG